MTNEQHQRCEEILSALFAEKSDEERAAIQAKIAVIIKEAGGPEVFGLAELSDAEAERVLEKLAALS